MSRAAIYRLLYGEEFIEKSIRSVIDAVDEVWVFWTNRVWGDCTEVVYKGEVVKFPEKFDNAVEVVRGIDSPKIRLVEDYQFSPINQFSVLANDHVDADVVMLIEADQVVSDAQAAFYLFDELINDVAYLPQIEYWKSEEYRIPQRARPGPIMWQTPLPRTRHNGVPSRRIPVLEVPVQAYNYGFCVSDQAMYWKHLTALAFSPVIGDSIPWEDWYDEIWLKWTPEMRGIDISGNPRRGISHAYKIG